MRASLFICFISSGCSPLDPLPPSLLSSLPPSLHPSSGCWRTPVYSSLLRPDPSVPPPPSKYAFIFHKPSSPAFHPDPVTRRGRLCDLRTQGDLIVYSRCDRSVAFIVCDHSGLILEPVGVNHLSAPGLSCFSTSTLLNRMHSVY